MDVKLLTFTLPWLDQKDIKRLLRHYQQNKRCFYTVKNTLQYFLMMSLLANTHYQHIFPCFKQGCSKGGAWNFLLMTSDYLQSAKKGMTGISIRRLGARLRFWRVHKVWKRSFEKQISELELGNESPVMSIEWALLHKFLGRRMIIV